LSLLGYLDVDWAGNADDIKSIIGGCFYIDGNLAAWIRKKYNSISLSIAKTEYIVVGSYCTQLLWMKKILQDYGFIQDTMTIYCDNSNAISIYMNSVQHTRTNHIDIRLHFIWDLVE